MDTYTAHRMVSTRCSIGIPRPATRVVHGLPHTGRYGPIAELDPFALFVGAPLDEHEIERELTVAQLYAGIDANGHKRVGRRDRAGSSSGDHEDIEDHWDLLERCWRLYYGMCLRKACGKRCLADELMGEVVDRLPSLVDKWDPTLGVPLRPYVILSLGWYLHKYVKRMQLHAERFVQLDGGLDQDEDTSRPYTDAVCERTERDKTQRYNNESVEDLLGRLDEDERLAIEVCVMDGETVQELAEQLGVSMKDASQIRQGAISRIKRIAALDEELDEDLRRVNRP